MTSSRLDVNGRRQALLLELTSTVWMVQRRKTKGTKKGTEYVGTSSRADRDHCTLEPLPPRIAQPPNRFLTGAVWPVQCLFLANYRASVYTSPYLYRYSHRFTVGWRDPCRGSHLRRKH